MNKNYECWRNQTLVNRVNSDNDIAREYYTLASYLFKHYEERMETIQTPLLHIVSHCIELSIKSVLESACRNGYIVIDTESFIHSHSLIDLSSFIYQIFNKIANDPSCPSEDKQLFSSDFPLAFQRLNDILQTDVPSYRYANKIDRKGNIKGKALPFLEDKDSPNILELSNIFDTCYSSLSYITYIFDFIFPEQS